MSGPGAENARPGSDDRHGASIDYSCYQPPSCCLSLVDRQVNKPFQSQAIEALITRQKQEASDMKLVRFIKEWLHDIWNAGMSLSTGLDSHKWESKIEILGHLSHR